MSRRPHVLVLSRNYPSLAMPTRGLWAERLARVAAATCDVTVVAPVPWVPPGTPSAELRRHRRTPRRVIDPVAGFRVLHPRVPAGYVQRMHAFDAALSWPAVRTSVERVHAERPIDLVHAHFIYPDGVLAARLGRLFGVPVVTSEHSFWRPWLDEYARVRGQVRGALPAIHTVTAVSEAVRRQADEIVAGATRTAVLPNVLDDETFTARAEDELRDPDELLFVGLLRRVKGLDVLVRALARLAPSRPRVRLRVIGEGLLRGYARDEAAVRALVTELGLAERVRFDGTASPADVARAMRRAAVVVVPSRRESFCSVVIEAMASGTPVVTTRCGGPDDLVDDTTGRLVPVEDPDALAAAITEVLDSPARFAPSVLRESAVRRFGRAASAARIAAFYADVLGAPRAPSAAASHVAGPVPLVQA